MMVAKPTCCQEATTVLLQLIFKISKSINRMNYCLRARTVLNSFSTRGEFLELEQAPQMLNLMVEEDNQCQGKMELQEAISVNVTRVRT
jgi:hypothetical protein